MERIIIMIDRTLGRIEWYFESRRMRLRIKHIEHQLESLGVMGEDEWNESTQIIYKKYTEELMMLKLKLRLKNDR